MNYQPVVIIGAPRSGTNMLRDVLTRFDGLATWPCDEINYIWRHGNVFHPSDEFPEEFAKRRVASYIRRRFDWVAHRYRAHTVVEKTCANSLRVPFVNAVLPEARYIFIYRDGVDAVASALKRWKAELNIPYVARKARFVPVSDLPFYALRYFWNRIYRLTSTEERLAFWGPRFKGFDEALTRCSLPEICALQWKRSVEMADEALSLMTADKVTRVSYESFVADPIRELQRLATELKLLLNQSQIAPSVADVKASNVGKGRATLDDDMTAAVKSLIGITLQRYGYR